jgi:hypothetical protein
MDSKSAEQEFQRPQVEIVVLNYNGFVDTVSCVESLLKISYPAFRIIIVDNASPDGDGERLKARFPNVDVLVTEGNLGYAGGNNRGIRHALNGRAELILVMNNDILVEPSFLTSMVELFHKQPAAGIVTCKVLYKDQRDRIFSAAGSFSRLFCTGLNHGGLFSASKRHTSECEVNFACGVLFLAKREVFQDVGLFDEELFMYFEDVEFSRRCNIRWKMFYTPLEVAYHKSGAGSRWNNYSPRYLYFHTRNRIWVFSNESGLYRTYVLLFTMLNAMAKAVVLLGNINDERELNNARLRALWLGFRDGYRGRGGAKDYSSDYVDRL